MNKNILVNAGVATAGLVVGGVAGYLVANHRNKSKYLRLAEEEIQSVKDVFTKRLETEFERPAFDGPVVEMPEEVNYRPDDVEDADIDVPEEVNVRRQHLFDPANTPEEPYTVQGSSDRFATVRYSSSDPTVVEEETEAVDPPSTDVRDRNSPYLISVDEFMDDLPEEGWSRISITYFEGDDILCDEREVVIPQVENVVGVASLTQFGVQSNDENIVYVRNERLMSDFEVTKDERKFMEVVYNLKQPKESKRKMREDD